MKEHINILSLKIKNDNIVRLNVELQTKQSESENSLPTVDNKGLFCRGFTSELRPIVISLLTSLQAELLLSV